MTLSVKKIECMKKRPFLEGKRKSRVFELIFYILNKYSLWVRRFGFRIEKDFPMFDVELHAVIRQSRPIALTEPMTGKKALKPGMVSGRPYHQFSAAALPGEPDRFVQQASADPQPPTLGFDHEQLDMHAIVIHGFDDDRPCAFAVHLGDPAAGFRGA